MSQKSAAFSICNSLLPASVQCWYCCCWVWWSFFVMTANNLSVYVRENINFSVLLNDDMKEAEAIRFQKQLEEEPFVKQATYISKAQALKEQTEAMGTDPAEFLGYNPFTASIEIKLNAAYANSDSLSWIQEKLLDNKKSH